MLNIALFSARLADQYPLELQGVYQSDCCVAAILSESEFGSGKENCKILMGGFSARSVLSALGDFILQRLRIMVENRCKNRCINQSAVCQHQRCLFAPLGLELKFIIQNHVTNSYLFRKAQFSLAGPSCRQKQMAPFAFLVGESGAI